MTPREIFELATEADSTWSRAIEIDANRCWAAWRMSDRCELERLVRLAKVVAPSEVAEAMRVILERLG